MEMDALKPRIEEIRKNVIWYRSQEENYLGQYKEMVRKLGAMVNKDQKTVDNIKEDNQDFIHYEDTLSIKYFINARNVGKLLKRRRKP